MNKLAFKPTNKQINQEIFYYWNFQKKKKKIFWRLLLLMLNFLFDTQQSFRQIRKGYKSYRNTKINMIGTQPSALPNK